MFTNVQLFIKMKRKHPVGLKCIVSLVYIFFIQRIFNHIYRCDRCEPANSAKDTYLFKSNNDFSYKKVTRHFTARWSKFLLFEVH